MAYHHAGGRASRLAAVGAVVAVAAFGLVGSVPAADGTYERLNARATQLRQAFNDDVGKVRLVLGVSATCGSCLRRAAMAQRHLLENFRNAELTAHIVWLPTHGTRERHVPEATRLVHDVRATHYWDPHGAFMELFREPLSEGPGDAEGVVMVYGPEARWRDEAPPVPERWVYEARDVRKLVAPLRRLLARVDG